MQVRVHSSYLMPYDPDEPACTMVRPSLSCLEGPPLDRDEHTAKQEEGLTSLHGHLNHLHRRCRQSHHSRLTERMAVTERDNPLAPHTAWYLVLQHHLARGSLHVHRKQTLQRATDRWTPARYGLLVICFCSK
jgi:hypothetical protein